MDVRKVPASAGAEWLLGGFMLLRRSPGGFGLLALSYAALWLTVNTLAQAVPALLAPLQLTFFLIGPLLLAGMIFAAREVDEGRSAAPAHLLASLRTGKAARLVSTVLPQLALMVLCAILLYIVVGAEHIENLLKLFTKLQAQAESQIPVDPSEFANIPFGRLFVWMLLVFGVGLAAFLFTFTLVPDMLFTDTRLVQGMGRCFRACSANLGALVVLLVLGFVVVMAIGFGFVLVSQIAMLVAGQAGLLIANAAFNGLMTVFASGVMYFAWKQLLGDGSPAPQSPSASTGIEV
jgi:hypothetical protein